MQKAKLKKNGIPKIALILKLRSSASKIYLYINFLLLPIIFPSLGKNKVYMFYGPPSPDADSPEDFKLASIGLFRLQVKFVSGI